MKNFKMEFNNVILKSIFALTFVGVVFLFNTARVSALDIVVAPAPANATADTNTVVATPAGTNVTAPAVADANSAVVVTTPVISIPATTYLESLDAHSLAIILPEKYDIGVPEYALEKMTGYEVNVYIYEKLIYSTGTAYRDAAPSTVNLEELVRNAAISDHGDCENIVFKVKYIGKNAAGEYVKAKDATGNELEWSSGPKTIYKVSVLEGDTVKASTYGFLGQTVYLTPNLQKGYSFKQWSDGNINNPRVERISANAADNKYVFTTEKSVVPEYDEDGMYDSVPTTGESNMTFILIISCVFGFMGTAYAFFGMILLPIIKK